MCGPKTLEEGWKLFVSKNVVSAPEFKVFNVALLLTAGGENWGDKFAIILHPPKGVFPSFLTFVFKRSHQLL